MSSPLLHHMTVTAPGSSPDRIMLCLHGIFGMGRNWTSFAQQLVQVRPAWSLVLVDLRLHGRSQGFPPPHSLEACAVDLDALAATLPHPVRGIMGHSFGGKVSMVFADHHGDELEQVWVLDSTPEAFRSATAVNDILELMKRLPMPMASRAAVQQALQAEGLSTPTAQWLATNVEPRGREFYWRFDFEGLDALIDDFYRTDLWPFVEAPHPFTLHLVKAERSEVLSEAAVDRLRRAEAAGNGVRFHELPDCGHWLHVDNPGGLLKLVSGEMPG